MTRPPPTGRPEPIGPTVVGDLAGHVPYSDETGDLATAQADRADLIGQCRRCGATGSARLCGNKIIEYVLPHQGRGGRWHRGCGGKIEYARTEASR
jgi:hypothetical protein